MLMMIPKGTDYLVMNNDKNYIIFNNKFQITNN